MRVFVAGAAGVIGRQLVPLLVSTGHEVFGTTRSSAKLPALRDLGASAVQLDILDAAATMKAVQAAAPDVIVHQATDLSAMGSSLRNFDKLFAATNRLRTEGTANLLDAGWHAGVTRFVAQSFGGWTAGADGSGEVPKPFRGTLAAIQRLEDLVAQQPNSVVLRYAGFYGPGTSLDAGQPQIEMVRKRRFPIVGDGGGVWSFVHVHDAATATLAALSQGSGVYNVSDDEPAPVREWLPYLAEVLGAEPPRHVPTWLARIVAGEAGVFLMTEIQGTDNSRAKEELSWKPRYSSWREGWAAELRGRR